MLSEVPAAEQPNNIKTSSREIYFVYFIYCLR
jgi:hypothetical protein